MPSRFVTPTRKFSTKTSASRARACAVSRSAGSRRSSVMDRLPRLAMWNIADMSPCRVPEKRARSGADARSILITSAPRSARMPAASGPESDVVTSRTLIPCSGPLTWHPPDLPAGKSAAPGQVPGTRRRPRKHPAPGAAGARAPHSGPSTGVTAASTVAKISLHSARVLVTNTADNRLRTSGHPSGSN